MKPRPDVNGAVISHCGQYRYSLWLTMLGLSHPGRERVLFIMLNPSTADADQDDPTIRRCAGYTKAWCYDSFEVVNLYALRATDPKELWKHLDPVGPGNQAFIEQALGRCQLVVCAWGVVKHLSTQRRYLDVLETVRSANQRPHYLRLTKDGHPAHPLYLSGKLQPTRWHMEGSP